ncbi:MAG: hypothetical protein JXB45_08700 [Candidatus Krumholzibacteriota bacterium]|nr:hypothetical protein [Candidatus Krumholzibacteriota bacterium]
MKHIIFQVVAITLISSIVALVFNAFSPNGINPLRKANAVAVREDPGPGESGMIRVITLSEFLVLQESGAVIIDARTAAQFRKGHIPGAILLDYYQMGYYMDHILPYLSPDEPAVLYCAGPLCDDSELLAQELYNMGYMKMLVFKGGMEEWEKSGLPLETGDNDPAE